MSDGAPGEALYGAPGEARKALDEAPGEALDGAPGEARTALDEARARARAYRALQAAQKAAGGAR